MMTSLSFAEPMKFAYYDSYAPRSYVENGKMKGIIIDIVDEAIKNRMHIDVVHSGYPWKRAQLLVEKGVADAFVTVPTSERAKYTFISKEPLFKFETFVAVMKGNPNIDALRKVKSINELKEYKLVDYYGNGWAQIVLKDHKVYWLPGYEDIFKFLSQGKADAIIVSRKSFKTIKELGYEDKIEVFKNPLTSVDFHLCISKKSSYAHILQSFDVVIKKMREEGVVDNIMNKYYGQLKQE